MLTILPSSSSNVGNAYGDVGGHVGGSGGVGNGEFSPEGYHPSSIVGGGDGDGGDGEFPSEVQ